ncbi:hypothetical protein BJ912DRAFT_927409 [Pholiota molesta]|nr:hypothetical protein BJ912DRAFT_927409 [Pholiota molesta]
MSQNPAQSLTSFEVQVHPNSRTANIYCTILRGGPCHPCNEFQHLQRCMVQATQENRDTTHAQNMRDLTLRHEINIEHDPMNVFPFEIKSLIFKLCCEPREVKVMPQVRLLSVCKQWREVAINAPRLWTIFPVPSISPGRFYIEQFKLWLQRSKSLPVYLSFGRLPFLSGYKEIRNYEILHGSTNTITDLVVANKGRIYGLNPTALPEVVLRKLFIVEWPILSHITINLSAISDALDVLQCCPRATFVEFQGVLKTAESQHGLGTNPMRRPFVDCPALRLLKVGFGQNSDPGGLFNCLSTPALEDLTCHSDATISPIPALQALLQRSSCSLHRLHLGHDEFDSSELTSFLAEQSALRTLSMAWRLPNGMDWDDLPETKDAFAAVTRLLLTDASGKEGFGRQFTTGEFLPRLESFEYRGPMPWSWNVMTNMCLSHPIDPLENDGQASGDQVDFRGSNSDTGASSVRYRPLRLLRLTIIDKFFAHSLHNNVHSFGLESLSKRVSCRFKCDFYDNELMANMYF